MPDLVPVIPDSDIWIRALSRSDPAPLVVHRLEQLVRARQVFLTGSIRQELLGLTRDERHFARLETALAAFPDLRLNGNDFVAAARILQRTRAAGVTPRQARLWAVAERIGATIWSADPRWSGAASNGCPMTV